LHPLPFGNSIPRARPFRRSTFGFCSSTHIDFTDSIIIRSICATAAFAKGLWLVMLLQLKIEQQFGIN